MNVNVYLAVILVLGVVIAIVFLWRAAERLDKPILGKEVSKSRTMVESSENFVVFVFSDPRIKPLMAFELLSKDGYQVVQADRVLGKLAVCCNRRTTK